VIEIISGVPSGSTAVSCDPTTPVPAPELDEWITHVPPLSGVLGTLGETEEEFARATLTADQGELLAGLCKQITAKSASGAGVCNCGQPG